MLLDLGKGSSRCPRLVNMYYKGAVRWRSAASARGHWVARARSLREFQTSFAAETSCAAFLFERRWPQGFVCPACGAGRAALLRSRAHTCECLDCGRQTSAAAGTVMHRSSPVSDLTRQPQILINLGQRDEPFRTLCLCCSTPELSAQQHCLAQILT